jgi:hypothetical protein
MVAEHLHFPRLLVDSMRVPTDEKENAPVDATQATLQTVGFAAQVGDILQRPDDDRDAALRELSQKYEDVFPLEEEHLRELVDRNLHEALDLIEVPKEWANDFEARLSSLRSPPDDEATEGDSAEDAPAATSEPNSHDDQLLIGIDEITNMLIAGQALNEVLGAILEVAFRALDVQRVVMFVNDIRTRQVAARFGIGAVDAALLKKLRFSLSERNALHGAIENGEDKLIEDSQAVHDNMPDWYRKHTGAATCALLPIRVNKILIGVIYADAGSAHSIDIHQFQYLKTLRNLAALTVSAQRKR